MIPAINPAYIFSELGNSASLLPMALKDVAHSAGMTTSSYITGSKVEGKDRLIDEVGAAAIWLGGLPFFKFVIDKTLYKVAKHDPNVDIRLLKDKDVLQKAIKYAHSEDAAKSIKKALEHEKTFKRLFMAKFIAATIFTLGSYASLTIMRHKHTEKTIIDELKKEHKQKMANNEFIKSKTTPTFEAFENQNKKQSKPSFGMNLSGLSSFMFNPVKNMMIVDGGITAERLGESRNPQDFIGYAIKEGSFWAFMYFAGPKIQEHFENVAEKKHNKSIGLDMRVLQDSSFHEAVKSKSVKKCIEEFPVGKSDAEIYEFLCTNGENTVVKAAKKSGIIKTVKGTDKIDTQAFIDMKEIKGVHKKIETLVSQLDSSNETVEAFMKKLVSLKKASILKNIVSCMGVLGLVVPGLMLAARYMDKNNKDFQVKKQIQEKMHKELYG